MTRRAPSEQLVVAQDQVVEPHGRPVAVLARRGGEVLGKVGHCRLRCCCGVDGRADGCPRRPSSSDPPTQCGGATLGLRPILDLFRAVVTVPEWTVGYQEAAHRAAHVARHDMKHGSESFFIEGEGLLTTQVGGRSGDEPDPVSESESPRAAAPRALAAGVAAAVPVLPGRPQGHRPRRGRRPGSWPARWSSAAGAAGDVPAGYTYLGQFLDHDLTMDRTDVMFGDDVRPVDLLQGRSPRLDLDSLYGNGPGDAASREVLLRRPAPQDRYDGRGPPDPPSPGTTCPGWERAEQGGEAQGADPRPAQRREPGGRPDAPGDDPLPQPGARQAAGLGAAGREVHPGPQARRRCTTSG